MLTLHNILKHEAEGEQKDHSCTIKHALLISLDSFSGIRLEKENIIFPCTSFIYSTFYFILYASRTRPTTDISFFTY